MITITDRHTGAVIRSLDAETLAYADLHRADLTRADLHGADLHGANLHEADLTGANLTGADLTGAYLAYANLHEADLTGADLTGADLTGANLHGADLSGANLTGADLVGADLCDVLVIHRTAGYWPAPEGAIRVYGAKGDTPAIVVMEVPVGASRSWATTRKLRVEHALVVGISRRVAGVDEHLDRLLHMPQDGPTTEYVVGEIVRADGWTEDRWVECGHGIHCFLSREEAEVWGRCLAATEVG